MAAYKTQFTLRRFKADTLLKEYMTAEQFEDCFNLMLVMEDTEPFEYYEIREEKVLPDGSIEDVSTSCYTKSADLIDEVYY